MTYFLFKVATCCSKAATFALCSAVSWANMELLTIVLEVNKTSKITVPKKLGQIVRNYWEETVNTYILKQGKMLTWGR
jgi:hypothetical protein